VVGDEVNQDSGVFKIDEVAANVKILSVACHESSIFRANGTIDHAFYSGEIGGFCTDIAIKNN
jgi:hypothetical protein